MGEREGGEGKSHEVNEHADGAGKEKGDTITPGEKRKREEEEQQEEEEREGKNVVPFEEMEYLQLSLEEG